MRYRALRYVTRLLLLTTCCLPALAQQVPTAFETASIRASQLKDLCGSLPSAGSSHFDATCVSLRTLLQMALVSENGTQLEGDQKALDTQYDIRASTANDEAWTYASVRPMLRQLLVDRFHLAYHIGSKNVPGYDMTVAKGGLKLIPLEHAAGPSGIKGNEPARNFFLPGRIHGSALSAEAIASFLAVPAEHPITNRTSLTGLYNMDLRFAPTDSTSSDLPSFFAAMKEQLGLELKPSNVTIKTVVIDHIDATPTEN